MALISFRKADILTFVVVFFVYTVLGAVFEHAIYYFSKDKKKVINNPVLTGFPLYGIAAYVIIGVHKVIGYKFNIIVQFLLYAAIATAIEYITGLIVGAGASSRNEDGTIKAWDYSQDPLNFKGIIKLKNFILFGIFAVIITRIHPFIRDRVRKMFD